jgi:uncharacterized membrane protein YeaQ/YmgE (transglycosylase-associated protein family)
MDAISSQLWTIIELAVGGFAGYVATKVLRRTGFGVIGDIIVGMIGGVAGAWLWGLAGGDAGLFYIHTLAASAVGGVVLLIVWRLISR